MRVVYLSGGVGGAKLALGLSHLLDPDSLTVVANTGDDFEHLGFPVCPDIDTLVYTLSGLAHPGQGWGRKDETGHFMETLRSLGGPDWFFLGDRDLAMHAERRRLMDEGMTLTEITGRLSRALGVGHPILPMCDEEAPTTVKTADGWLSFQDYFVRRRAEPAVTGLGFLGGDDLEVSGEVWEALSIAELVIIGPSNPLISIGPILHLGGLDDALEISGAPVMAVSPIVGGRAVKGPTAKMMAELGMDVSVTGVARHYRERISHLVIDEADAGLHGEVTELIGSCSVAPTVMETLDDRIALARHVLDTGGGC